MGSAKWQAHPVAHAFVGGNVADAPYDVRDGSRSKRIARMPPPQPIYMEKGQYTRPGCAPDSLELGGCVLDAGRWRQKLAHQADRDWRDVLRFVTYERVIGGRRYAFLKKEADLNAQLRAQLDRIQRQDEPRPLDLDDHSTGDGSSDSGSDSTRTRTTRTTRWRG